MGLEPLPKAKAMIDAASLGPDALKAAGTIGFPVSFMANRLRSNGIDRR
jgi:hypothetical protein